MQAINEVRHYLQRNGLLHVSEETLWFRVQEEDHESIDCSIRPLEERLARIFELCGISEGNSVTENVCQCFMKPIFARGRCYVDSLPALKELKMRGYTTAIVSNTSWGSPAYLWREEVKCLGLSAYIDELVFCRDVGWRKPARQIFLYPLEKLSVAPENCVFVGDEPRWDIAGPQSVGITPILVDRLGARQLPLDPKPISALNELLDRLRLLE